MTRRRRNPWVLALLAAGLLALVPLAVSAFSALEARLWPQTLEMEPRPARWDIRPGETVEVALLLRNAGDAPLVAEVAVTPKGMLRVGDGYLFHSKTDAGWLAVSPPRRVVTVPAGGEALAPFTLTADAASAPVTGGATGFTLRWSEDGRAYAVERNVAVDVVDAPLPFPLRAILVLGALGALAGGVFAWLGRLDHHRLLGLALAPLYSRIRRADALESERRRRIMHALQESPGLHFAELRRRTSLAHGALHHHLRILEENGLVTSRRERGRRRYAPAGAAPQSFDITPAERRLLDALPPEGIAPADLAARLGITRQGVHHHAGKLAERGLLRRERVDGTWRYYRG